MLIGVSAKSQKWQPGYFVDVKGNRETGFIRIPSGKGPIKDEGFIEFKQDDKSNPFKLSASDIQTFVIGRDSFVVAHAPENTSWTKKELDFVEVVLDEETKLYVTRAGIGGGGGKAIGVSPEVGAGVGTGGYSGVGGGVAVNIGGGGGSGSVRTIFFYGPNTADMHQLTPINFKDVMSDIMGDEPDVVDKIQANQFNLDNIGKLINYFEKVKASHQGQ